MAKIMTVDDSNFMRQLIKKMLEKAGYTNIIEAESGPEALEKYKREKPDLVLLDIILGRDMSGIDTLRELKKMDPDVKVIMVTVLDQPQVEEEARGLGATHYVTKPIHEKELIDAVTENLKHSKELGE